MNKRFKSGIVWVAVLFMATAQLSAQGLQIGVYTEPQLAWITSDESTVVSNGNLFNLNTGIEFDMYFMPNYAISLGVALNNQGGKMLYSDSVYFQQTNGTLEVPGGTSLKHRLQYVGVPVGLKLRSAQMGYTTFYIHGGLVPMINLKATTSSDQEALVRENIQPEIGVFNMNYFIELGVQYRLAGNTALVGGFKWSAGVTDITDNDFATNNLTSAGLHLGILF